MSLCWQNVERVAASGATDNSVCNVRARVMAWLQNAVSGFGGCTRPPAARSDLETSENEIGPLMYLNLKLQLFKTGMRQNRLAQQLGVDESILSKIVNGFREPSQEMRARIATLLQSDEEWLFERAEATGAPTKRGAAALRTTAASEV